MGRQKLWRRAKRLCGGNMLLSKRAEMFLQNIGRPISQEPKVVMLGSDGRQLPT